MGEREIKVAKACMTHGESRNKTRTKELSAWRSINTRCYNRNYIFYHKFGGVGIENHYESFQQFLEDVGRAPAEDFILDRIDYSTHFGPGNCFWSPRSEKQRRVVPCIQLQLNGETHSFRSACKELEISRTKFKNFCVSNGYTDYQKGLDDYNSRYRG